MRSRQVYKCFVGIGSILNSGLPGYKIRLHKNREKRVLAGHLWIFANEIETDFKSIPPGSLVEVNSFKDHFLGIGYINPHSLIAVRLLTREKEEISKSFFRKRIDLANQRRILLYPNRSTYRLCYSEGDFLPGLIVDKYEEFLVLQILTAGMDIFKDQLTEVIWQLLNPKAIIFRNDPHYRLLEGLTNEKRLARGEFSAPASVEIEGLKFVIDFLEGQKTGFYLDQVENRLALKTLVKNKKVLDAFCYNGAWGLTALHFGAREATFVDSSASAINLAKQSAKDNNLTSKCMYHQENVFEFLKNAEDHYDVVIIDPPAFVKSKAKIKEAVSGYVDLNRKAMEKTAHGGILVSCSCSHHISVELFEDIIRKAGQLANRQIRLLERRSQAKDHPILLAVPETEYLKCLFLEVL